MKLILVGLAVLWLQGAQAVAQTTDQDVANAVMQSIVSIHEQIQKEGFENVLKKAKWPKARVHIENRGQDMVLNLPDNPADDCIFNPSMAGCPGAGTGDWGSWGGWGNGGNDPFGTGSSNVDPNILKNMTLKDDGIQILATEVLYQTLTSYKVKHVFGKIKAPNVYGFKVIDPVPGGAFQDLDNDMVLGAIKQFRKYIIGLLCNIPDAPRMLQLVTKVDVGTRFRWDMAWALLGNELPDTPNKNLRFGARWRKYSMAMDSIENGSLMRLRNSFGGYSTFDPTGGAGKIGGFSQMGNYASSAIAVVRLVGDLAATIKELFCKSDLSVDAKKENEKKQIVERLLALKKQLYDRYSPYKAILEEMGKKASSHTGYPISFMP